MPLIRTGRLFLPAAMLSQLLLSTQIAFAQEAPTATQPVPTTEGTLLRFGFMFVTVYLIFYFMVIKPQRQKINEQKNLLSSLKRGEQVVTSGGMLAKVAGVEKEHVLLEIAPNVKVKFEIAHISKRLDKAEKAEAA